MKIESPSHLLAVVGWLSVFIEGWLMVLRLIPADALSWGFFAVFFIVALFASAITNGGKKKAQ